MKWWKIALIILVVLVIIYFIVKATSKKQPTQVYTSPVPQTTQQGINLAQFGSLLGSIVNAVDATKSNTTTSSTGTTTNTSEVKV